MMKGKGFLNADAAVFVPSGIAIRAQNDNCNHTTLTSEAITISTAVGYNCSAVPIRSKRLRPRRRNRQDLRSNDPSSSNGNDSCSTIATTTDSSATTTTTRRTLSSSSLSSIVHVHNKNKNKSSHPSKQRHPHDDPNKHKRNKWKHPQRQKKGKSNNNTFTASEKCNDHPDRPSHGRRSNRRRRCTKQDNRNSSNGQEETEQETVKENGEDWEARMEDSFPFLTPLSQSITTEPSTFTASNVDAITNIANYTSSSSSSGPTGWNHIASTSPTCPTSCACPISAAKPSKDELSSSSSLVSSWQRLTPLQKSKPFRPLEESHQKIHSKELKTSSTLDGTTIDSLLDKVLPTDTNQTLRTTTDSKTIEAKTPHETSGKDSMINSSHQERQQSTTLTDLYSLGGLRHRRPYNMTRLRNQWWQELAFQTIRNNFLLELKELFAKQSSIDDDDDDDDNHLKDEADDNTTSQKIAEEKEEDGSVSSSSSSLVSFANSSTREINLSTTTIPNNPFDHLQQSPPTMEELVEQMFAAAQQGQVERLMTLWQIYLRQSEGKAPKKSKESLTRDALRDQHGNTLLHHCCLGKNSTESTLQWLFSLLLLQTPPTQPLQQSSLLSSSSSWYTSPKSYSSARTKQFAQAILAQNSKGQTCFHFACQNNRLDLVERILSTIASSSSSSSSLSASSSGTGSSSLLTQLWTIQDCWYQTPLLAAVAANATNVVMCLIMWRVNHYNYHTTSTSTIAFRNLPQSIRNKNQNSKRTNGSSSNCSFPPCCPLVWAAKHGNLDMICLLLEFRSDDVSLSTAVSPMCASTRNASSATRTATTIFPNTTTNSTIARTDYHITEALHACILCYISFVSSTNDDMRDSRQTRGTMVRNKMDEEEEEVDDATNGDDHDDDRSEQSYSSEVECTQPELSKEVILQCMRVLMEGGANPFQQILLSPTLSHSTNQQNATCSSALNLAVSCCGRGNDGGGGGNRSDDYDRTTGKQEVLKGKIRDGLPNQNHPAAKSTTTTFEIAPVLRLLLTYGRKKLEERQQQRRRNPILRQQPESFFANLEGLENKEMNHSISTALLHALLGGWFGTTTANADNRVVINTNDSISGNSDHQPSTMASIPFEKETVEFKNGTSTIHSTYLLAAATLLCMGAQLHELDFARLRWSLANGTKLLQRQFQKQLGVQQTEEIQEYSFSKSIDDNVEAQRRHQTHCLVATYTHYSGPISTNTNKIGSSTKEEQSHFDDIERSQFLSYWSYCLVAMPWMQELLETTETICPWLIETNNEQSLPTDVVSELEAGVSMQADNNDEINDKVVLITSDGGRFPVHAWIVSQKSEKLAAAIRFARMNRGQTKNEKNRSSPEGCIHMIDIKVGITSHFCKLLIQHIYHGSIVGGWTNPSLYPSHGSDPSLRRKSNARNCNVDSRNDMFQDIVELLLVAEEFLCPSLIQECEMRLLTVDPSACCCWSCASTVRRKTGAATQRFVSFDEAECLYSVVASNYSTSTESRNENKLVVAESALDVLAIVMHLESTMAMDMVYHLYAVPLSSSISAYHLKCTPSRQLWLQHAKANAFHKYHKMEEKNMKENLSSPTSGAPDAVSGNSGHDRWAPLRAMAGLKDTAICAILNDFPEVLRSNAYHQSSRVTNVQIDAEPKNGMKHEGLEKQNSSTIAEDDEVLSQTLLLKLCLEELAASPCTSVYTNER